MKFISKSQFAFSNRRLLISLFFALLSVSLAFVGLGAISKGSGDTKQSMSSPQTGAASTASDQPNSKNATPRDNTQRYLDQEGHRASAFKPAPAVRAKHQGRPAGVAAWVSLGPPGGDVLDVGASPVDASIVLAGLAPGGRCGGTLYRSSDGGNTWSEVPALDGTSVFDIEFAPDGTAYLGTQDSIWKSTDGGLNWAVLNLGIGLNDQVFDVALDPADSSIMWAGIADALAQQPVNVMRSTDGGATWANRTPTPH